jgi:uracil-DNA glycosylase family 4
MSWLRLKQDAKACSACGLCATRKNVVFGQGNLVAKMILIGEAPGAVEDAQGMPLVGASGQLLKRLLEEANVPFEDVYFTNSVKCRPPANRRPQLNETNACGLWLVQEVGLIKPTVIVTLGAVALSAVLGVQMSIEEARQQRFDVLDMPGIDVFPTYHPSYVLRTPKAEKYLLKDLKDAYEAAAE